MAMFMGHFITVLVGGVVAMLIGENFFTDVTEKDCRAWAIISMILGSLFAALLRG